jgi:calcium permeable stress-gated cation channel
MLTPNPESAAAISSAVDASTGKARERQGLSLSSFVASLTVAVAIFGAEILLFFVLKDKLPTI